MAVPTSWYKPELGLPLNPGSEHPIQNAAMGEEGHVAKIYREASDGEITLAGPSPGVGANFVPESIDPILNGFFDVSNCSGVSLFVNSVLGGLTSIDIYPVFWDLVLASVGYLASFDGAVVAGDIIYTLKKTVFRLTASDQYIITIPVANYPFMGFHIDGTGVAAGSSLDMRYARGWTQNMGIFSV